MRSLHFCFSKFIDLTLSVVVRNKQKVLSTEASEIRNEGCLISGFSLEFILGIGQS